MCFIGLSRWRVFSCQRKCRLNNAYLLDWTTPHRISISTNAMIAGLSFLDRFIWRRWMVNNLVRNCPLFLFLFERSRPRIKSESLNVWTWGHNSPTDRQIREMKSKGCSPQLSAQIHGQYYLSFGCLSASQESLRRSGRTGRNNKCKE
jgi:hypothetical protein